MPPGDLATAVPPGTAGYRGSYRASTELRLHSSDRITPEGCIQASWPSRHHPAPQVLTAPFPSWEWPDLERNTNVAQAIAARKKGSSRRRGHRVIIQRPRLMRRRSHRGNDRAFNEAQTSDKRSQQARRVASRRPCQGATPNATGSSVGDFPTLGMTYTSANRRHRQRQHSKSGGCTQAAWPPRDHPTPQVHAAPFPSWEWSGLQRKTD